MDAVFSIDSLYLSIRYPRDDVFKRWYRYAENVPHDTLKAGVVVGDFLVKTGFRAYRCSVWRGDIRAFLSERVDDNLNGKPGNGIWLQIGPRFLGEHMHDLQDAVGEYIREIGVRGDWEKRINRLDFAIDILGADMNDQLIDDWRFGWVGRSGVASAFINTRTGALETINIGSRESVICFRAYNKVAQAKKMGMLSYWRERWNEFEGPVTRLEWEVHLKDSGFVDLKEFDGLSDLRIKALLNYLTSWGRLAIPDEAQSKRDRWKNHPFWQQVLDAIEEWLDGVTWTMAREGKGIPEFSEGYASAMQGNLSSLIATANPDNPNFADAMEKLEQYGYSLDHIYKKANEKAEIIKRS